MNVLLISQCNKRALTETRRVLDQFTERRGDRTWQTAITMEGLNTLRKLLRKTARKNTAIACHWIRGKDHSELMWIVGDARRFNVEGAVPTNSTNRDVLRRSSENDWHTGEDIQLLAQMAGLLHDLGKASVAFQKRLRGDLAERNLYRHEWVSLRLFQAFVGEDDDSTWLTRLANPSKGKDDDWLAPERYFRDGLDKDAPKPFTALPPLAAAIGWLVVTHHRLPVKPAYDQGQQLRLGKKLAVLNANELKDILNHIGPDWNEQVTVANQRDIQTYWGMAGDLPVSQSKWREKATDLANRLLALHAKRGKEHWLSNPYVMHIARMALMLADHHYSALPRKSAERVKGEQGYTLYANTDEHGMKQALDEHLMGVARLAGKISRSLPSFEQQLPRLARHRGLKRRSTDVRFRWQDKAADVASSIREEARSNGAFIVNMASTGCGKTLANARILYAISDPQQGMRATYALGLRTLTLQTGRSYREDLHLGEDELAVRVGGTASKSLFEYWEQKWERTGSASVQDLIDEDSHVLYEGQQAQHALLSSAMADTGIRDLLSAPFLVCTVDHMTPATEAQRAGRQIAPMLRLMSSDLVLDELDDFDLNDLPALTRLVYWAGLLGSRILLSSATLAPSLVQGMFLAYRAGREQFQRNRGIHGGQQARFEITCLWADEFAAHAATCFDDATFEHEHAAFVDRRVKSLTRTTAKSGPRRLTQLFPLDIESRQRQEIHKGFARQVHSAVLSGHAAHHGVCPRSGKTVSIGLVRMANIEPLIDVAKELFQLGAPENHHIHLCVYHARFPLLLRSAIEHQLDAALDRREPDAIYELPSVRQRLDSNEATHHIFVVLASPVAEVGRDHDYDWAVVEPSSMRSLIQLAGRVQRHREIVCSTPNIFLFDTNLRHFTGRNDRDGQPGAAFVRPGFETENAGADGPYRLTSHRLGELLDVEEYREITARPRIQARPAKAWRPKSSLVDLEHARLVDQMLPKRIEAQGAGNRFTRRETPLNAASAWQHPQSLLTWVLQQQQPFRHDTGRDVELVFLPDEDEECLIPHRIHEPARRGKPALYTPAKHEVSMYKLSLGPRISPWFQEDLLDQMRIQAEDQEKPLSWCAERYATVTVPESRSGWRYNNVLGCWKNEPD